MNGNLESEREFEKILLPLLRILKFLQSNNFHAIFQPIEEVANSIYKLLT